MRNVRDRQQSLVQCFIAFPHLLIKLLDPGTKLAHRLLTPGGILAGLFQPAEFFGRHITFIFKLFDFTDQGATPFIQPGNLLDIHIGPAMFHRRFDPLRIVT
jgi:hypothetical protein